MFSKGDPKPPTTGDGISAFLGKETSFEGKMTFEGVFRLDGRFEGEIFDSGILIVGETAVVRGNIGIQTLIINGVVEGDVHARSHVEIHPTGKFCGTLATPVLVVNEGGILEGNCRMGQTRDRQEGNPSLPREEGDPEAPENHRVRVD